MSLQSLALSRFSINNRWYCPLIISDLLNTYEGLSTGLSPGDTVVSKKSFVLVDFLDEGPSCVFVLFHDCRAHNRNLGSIVVYGTIGPKHRLKISKSTVSLIWICYLAAKVKWVFNNSLDSSSKSILWRFLHLIVSMLYFKWCFDSSRSDLLSCKFHWNILLDCFSVYSVLPMGIQNIENYMEGLWNTGNSRTGNLSKSSWVCNCATP